MPVSSPEAARAQPSVPGARERSLAFLALLAAALLSLAPAAHAAKAPKILSKSKILAPHPSATVKGTLSGAKCAVRFPATTRGVKITVQGPLSVKKPKTKRLKVKGTRSAKCTWKTTSFADGKYRFTVKARVKASGRYWTISIKRSVIVRNRVNSVGATATGGEGPQLGVGNARYVGRLESQWDSWLGGANAERQTWMRQKMWGVVAHSPFFDSMTSWSPPALLYKDLYAIYRDDAATLNAHPEWVLKDAAGQRMTIPWGCDPGPCPQFAGDIGSPSFRAEWINQARATLAHGYSGLWIDDANMEMRISDAAGVQQAPIDPRTGKPMTFLNYRRYIAEFLEQIRREMPQTQLVANVLWFGGTSVGRDADPFVQRAYSSVNRLNLERGFNDDGLTNGYAPRDIWAVETFMDFIDRMHDRGIPVTLDSAGYGVAAWEYNLAGFFLVDRGSDAVGELRLQPGEWWNGWNVQLGSAVGERDRRGDGVFTRTFQKGVVYLNPQRAPTKTIKLAGPMKRIDGTTVTSITLGAARGAVLLKP